MSQLINPIQGKLSKMRSSQMIRCNGHTESTPLKINLWTETEKQNLNQFHSSHHSKQLQKKQNQNSVRKLTLLERKSVQKQQSNNFYRNQLCRRKMKYQNQLIQSQQKYQRQITELQNQLIEDMKKQQQMDLQTQLLLQLYEKIQQFSVVQKMNDQVLQIFDSKLRQFGIAGCQLIYSAQTVFDSKGNQCKAFFKQDQLSQSGNFRNIKHKYQWQSQKKESLQMNSNFSRKLNQNNGSINCSLEKYFLRNCNGINKFG